MRVKNKISLIVFSAFLVVLYLYYSNRNQVLKDRYLQAQDEITIYKHQEANYYKSIIRLSKEIKKDPQTVEDILVSNSNGDSLTLKNILHDSTRLIYRFKETSCDACYSDQIAKLKILSKHIGISNIILLVSFNNRNSLKVLTNTYNLDFSIYNIDQKLISDWPLEKYNEPYQFIFSKDYSSLFFFAPDKTLPDLTEKYFEVIKTYFSSDQ